jgi:two-component system, NarL family, invasion response regulator UvrY
MLRTMLVEDNLNFRKVVKDTLQDQFPSMDIIEARSGEEAIQKAGSESIDLIFMDIGLPGKNGLETTKEIKANYQDIPIAILTGNDSPEYRRAASERGAICFLNKATFEWQGMFTIVNCFHNAKQDGRRPFCIQGVSDYAYRNHLAS